MIEIQYERSVVCGVMYLYYEWEYVPFFDSLMSSSTTLTLDEVPNIRKFVTQTKNGKVFATIKKKEPHFK